MQGVRNCEAGIVAPYKEFSTREVERGIITDSSNKEISPTCTLMNIFWKGGDAAIKPCRTGTQTFTE